MRKADVGVVRMPHEDGREPASRGGPVVFEVGEMPLWRSRRRRGERAERRDSLEEPFAS